MRTLISSGTFVLLVATAAAQTTPDGELFRIREPKSEAGRRWSCYLAANVSPDGKTIAVSDESGRLELWTTDGKCTAILAEKGPKGSCPRWSPDGQRLYAGHDRGLAVWSAADAKLLHVWETGFDCTSSPEIAVTGDGTLIAASWTSPMLVVWDRDGKERFRLHSAGGVAWTADGRHLIRAWMGRRFDIHRATDGAFVSRIGPEYLENRYFCSDRVVFSPDGRHLACWEERGDCVLRDVRTGVIVRRFHTHQDYGVAICFSPDGNWIATGGRGETLKIWEVDTGLLLFSRNAHNRYIKDIHWSADGRTVVTGSGDLTVAGWSTIPKGTGAIRFVPEMLQAVGSEHVARLITAVSEDPVAPAELTRLIPQAPRPDESQLKRLLGELDARRHQTRERATQQLVVQGRTAIPLVRQSLEKPVSAEAADRAERILRNQPADLSPVELTHRRVVTALAVRNDSAARKLLEYWSGGAEGAVLTDESRRQLARLPKR